MDIEVIEVEVDDQAQTSALGALTDADAAKALRLETERAPSPRIAPSRATQTMGANKATTPAMKAADKPKLKADGTQEIELGDVLEVMQKMPGSKSAAANAVPTVELAADPVVTPAPVSQPANPNATMEIRPGDVLEELVADAPAPPSVRQKIQAAPLTVQQQMQPMQQVAAPPMFDIPAFPEPAPEPAASASDLAKTTVRPPAGPQRTQLAQFSVDDEVAPFASDTVDIPLNRVAGLPIWLQIKGKPGVAIVAGAVGACALIGALAIGIHFHNAHNDDAAADATTHTSTTNASMNHDDPSAAIPPPPATPDVPSVSIDDLKKDGHGKAVAAADNGDNADPPTPHAWAPPSHHSHASHHSDPPAAPATFVSTKKVTAKQPQGFGLIRTWIAARGETISVDGKAVGTAPSPVKVACGPHTVAIGAEIVKTNVPCDGTITVGSPDHKK